MAEKGMGSLLLVGALLLLLMKRRPAGDKSGDIVGASLLNGREPAFMGGGGGGFHQPVAGPNETHFLTIQVRNDSKNAQGTPIDITFDAMTFYIYEGSALATRGTLLTTVQAVSASRVMLAGETKTIFSDWFLTAPGSIDRRDVGFVITHGGKQIAKGEWDDIFYVRGDVPSGSILLTPTFFLE